SVGDAVEAQIIRIEPSDDPKKPDRISLSLKSLQQDPWEGALDKGARRKGKVVRLEPFGAFVELAEGVEGLVHVSEIADRRIGHPREVLSVGQEVEVLVLEVDEKERRASLSIRQAERARERDDAAGYRPGGA